MKGAAKSKKEETEYNYVNQYIEMAAPRMRKSAMAYDRPNKAASRQRIESWQRQRQKEKFKTYCDHRQTR